MSDKPLRELPSLADSRAFWQILNVLIIVLHLAGAYAWLRYGVSAPAAVLWLIMLGLHVLELPMAFIALRGHSVSLLRLVVGTLLFGFTWWVPARRGIRGY